VQAALTGAPAKTAPLGRRGDSLCAAAPPPFAIPHQVKKIECPKWQRHKRWVCVM